MANSNTASPAMCIDTHIHFWELKRFPYRWPDEGAPDIMRRDILPSDYALDVRDTPMKNAIFVQVLNKNHPENEWVFELAKTNKWIVGVVGWVDLTDPNVESILKNAAQNPLFLGVRHLLAFENSEWIGREDVQNGLKALEKLNLTYDLTLLPPLLHWAAELPPKFPNLTFIIDHIAQPYIKDHITDGWKEGIVAAAKHPNVFIKLSELVTSAGPDWTAADIKPYVEHVVKHFGAKRCMYGSDYPIFKMVGATYTDVYQLLIECLKDCTTAEEREGIFGQNAVDIYKIKVPLNK
ncbi:L-fucono-1,5-lactonase-like [Amphiura filiformis]|uniref:L-fucono-1,5-lactonase-like n=1 Tax=Amphiura filiformis TaxID=82378 RepID=UPI003B2225E9